MYHNAVQLFLKAYVQLLGVVLNPINADEQVRRYGIFIIAHIEGDDVGIIVVIQVVFIYLQQKLIATKYVVDGAGVIAFSVNNVGYPLLQLLSWARFEINVGVMEEYRHRGRF